MSFSVSVRLDMQGKRSCAIHNLTSTMKVEELKKRIADKEGLDDLSLRYRAKPLQDHLTLADYNIRMNSTIFASARLRGGEDHYRKWDQTQGKKHGLTATKKPCELFISDVDGTCTSDGVWRVEFDQCNHVYCSNCLAVHLKDRIVEKKRKDLPCPMSCNNRPDVDALFVAAALTEDEEKTLGIQVDENFMGENVCPSEKCGIFVHGADDINIDQVVCRACQHVFCKHCKIKWTASGPNVCGNLDCPSSAHLLDMLENCDRITVSGIPNVPKCRMCPSCTYFIEWKEGCKRMTCKNCKLQFCLACLKTWNKGCGYSTTCTAADVQTV